MCYWQQLRPPSCVIRRRAAAGPGCRRGVGAEIVALAERRSVSGRATVPSMQTDLLGPPYECRVLPLGRDAEGPVVATLVRRRSPRPTRRAVLWVHGWSDYFFQTHVADFFVGIGYDFYALDLRKYGRSLRSYQTPTFCVSLSDYFAELDESARIIRTEHGHDTLVLAAHSTGALTSALWAHGRQATRPVDAMFLNSPFFDINLPAWLRTPGRPTVAAIGRRHPYRILPRPTSTVYGRSLHVDYCGEWSYRLDWKPVGGFPVRYGWLAAITAAQRRLHAGLGLDLPVLVGCSAGSGSPLHWQERARGVDTVLNVADIVRWSPYVGHHVTLRQFDGGLHDLTLSAAPVRQVVFNEVERWLATYVAGETPARSAPAGGTMAPLTATVPPPPATVAPQKTVAPSQTAGRPLIAAPSTSAAPPAESPETAAPPVSATPPETAAPAPGSAGPPAAVADGGPAPAAGGTPPSAAAAGPEVPD